MSTLSALIRSSEEKIAQRWADRLIETMVTGSLDREDVIDSLREFLRELERALAEDPTPELAEEPRRPPRSAIAVEHGSQRFRLGSDIASLIREYAHLRDVLFELIEESGLPFSVAEERSLAKHLIGAISSSAAQYAVELEEALRRQASKHLAFLAHELRNPLNSAELALEALRQTAGSSENDRYFPAIERSLRTMKHLIDSALIDQRLKAAADLQLEQLSIREIVEEVVRESDADIFHKRLQLDLRMGDAAELTGDRKLLRSAISNLIRNAVKFSHEGGRIRVTAKRDVDRLTLDVEDACGGLRENEPMKLFDPFVQAGADRSGFGLGLAIAKHAVESHGGAIRVHDLPGKGCVFVLDLPLTPSPPKGQTKP